MSRRDIRLDREVAALLAARAFTEIWFLAGRARRRSDGSSPDEDVDRIRFLADLCHNLPGIARPRSWRPSRLGAPASSREQAMAQRPMGWTWQTTGPDGQAWMLRHIEQAGLAWTPPPPLPARRKGPSAMTLQQQVSVLLRRWPVRTPAGRQRLPAEAHVLKALDTAAVRAAAPARAAVTLWFDRTTPPRPRHGSTPAHP
ncbi:hypothetical protein GCM10010168_24550 [Actinoplanes ianthinogenes]|uniref:Uncharacterized protein n=1 Tax=Actinoplanes ianthinogenes TaxID=122358 RepID=A0ABM7M8X4_9ACTN|nr:hypothetical protein [Actinoplanes ianthinogenes]BCJ48095.1 hypothetical protein Aiant_87520 [Actinoplanes ianthinogenes]GGR06375.1 hypothetical protein GCM10010168_24550 [Actinoplanes ianthinogenes]